MDISKEQLPDTCTMDVEAVISGNPLTCHNCGARELSLGRAILPINSWAFKFTSKCRKCGHEMKTMVC
jgi:DNA-directed RNA polymerase subunit RPC12/RpoP